MSTKPEVAFDQYDRELLAYFHKLLPDTHDREYLSDEEIVAMWEGYSRSMFASWLVHDDLSRDVAIGMLRGWSASLYKAEVDREKTWHSFTAADHIAALVAMGAERFYSFDDGEEVLSLYKIPEEMRNEPCA